MYGKDFISRQWAYAGYLHMLWIYNRMINIYTEIMF